MSNNDSSEYTLVAVPKTDGPARETPSRFGTIRKVILLAILGTAMAALAFQTYQQRILEADAAPLVEKAVEEFKEPGLDVVSQLTVTRDPLFFGSPRVKVEVFVRPTGSTEPNAIRGIEYHYVRDNNQWILQDSGSCTSEQCSLRGFKAFGQ